MISLLANIGILFLAVYFYLRSNLGLANQENVKMSYFIQCILLEVLVGIVLLSFSTVILGMRYDFRFLMFCFSARYLDWKITSSSILLLGLIRFVWGSTSIAQVNLIVSIVMAITLPLIVRYTKNRLNDLPQLLILVTYCLIPSVLLTNHIIADKSLVLSICLILFSSGYAATFVMHQFISDLHRLIASADTDHLTTLKNVRTFNNDLVSMERGNKFVTLAVIDIDRFKDYNDNYGHESGDALLIQLAQVFYDLAIPSTAFYRIGGEEFAVIINNPNSSEAENFMHNLQKIIANKNFYVTSGEPVNVTISVGVAHNRIDEILSQTLKRADIALYKAKQDGRNKVIVSFPQ